MESLEPDEISRAMEASNSLTLAPEPDPTCACFIVIDSDQPAKCRSCSGIFKPVVQLQENRNKALTTLAEVKRKLEEAIVRDEATSQEISRLVIRVEELEVLMDSKAEELARLQRDMQYMGEKVVDEIDKRAELQVSRDALHEELEELTKTLFEEANVLVADEARKRHFHENREKNLEQELASLKLQLQMEQLQLRELQIKMEEAQAKKERQQLQRIKDADSKDSRSNASTLQTEALTDVTEQPEPVTLDPIDPSLLAEFEDFLKQAPTVKLNKLNTLSFMKNAIEDDVTPCLRFGGNPRTSTRRLVDAIVQNSCFVEEMSNSQITGTEIQNIDFKDYLDAQQAAKSGTPVPPRRSSSIATDTERAIIAMTAAPTQTIFQKTVMERISTWTITSGAGSVSSLPPSVVIGGCSTCGRIGPTKHHFKITEQKEDSWCPICQQCRDRLVATCDFYNFVRHVRQGLYSTRRREDLYIEVLTLKRKMFFARMGAFGHIRAEKPFNGTSRSLLRPDSQLLRTFEVGGFNGDGSSEAGSLKGSPSLSRALLGENTTSSATASSSSSNSSGTILPPPPAALR
jgi:hypothetical protein